MMLRTRIAAVAVAVTVLAIALILATSYRNARDLVIDQLEYSLNDRADAAVAVLNSGAVLPPRPDIVEQLVRADGSVKSLTPGGRILPVTAADQDIAGTGSGTARVDIELDGEPYDIITRPAPGGAVMVAQHYRESERIDKQFLWRTAGVTIGAVLLSALLAWLAIGRILRPVRRLLTATEHITTTRDLSTTLPGAGHDEIGRLTKSFDTMLRALRQSRAQQQRLVQDAGHELRTPLTSIRGSAELLQRARGRLPEADETQVLTTLVTEIRALDELVGELVELSTDQYADEDAVRLELADVAEECARRFRHRTGRTITVSCTAPEPVRARPKALARCVDNLLGNAVKFSPAGTPIDIRILGTRLAVHDRGPGIESGSVTAIFDRFHRTREAQGTAGSGLGLAIVADIVAAHHGTVFAEPGPGGTIGFELPPCPAAQP
ncbi:HAMP domain-containing sensor histidine kinase [Nocardia inohanensis]|uniref:HAMP domain-containing sensor histidine kinase n=1 Tax=Nocardia inohanensis TaxID=209246 RepID=UPI00082F24BE|nr:HAMP domain-containing sensor histidine kinase [Nocardia inohanensis]